MVLTVNLEAEKALLDGISATLVELQQTLETKFSTAIDTYSQSSMLDDEETTQEYDCTSSVSAIRSVNATSNVYSGSGD